MNILLIKKNQVRFLMICAVVLILLAGFILFPYGKIALILYILIGLVSIIGIVCGTVLALAVTLVLFFVIGSTLFWLPTEHLFTVDSHMPLLIILVWMSILLILSLVTGKLSILLKEMHEENVCLKENMRQLIAVDPSTGFDNRDRMLLEIQMEYSRAKRHGHTFTLLLIKLNHLTSFKKLYGEAEMIRLLKYMSAQIYELTRTSDHKYRPERDILGILLTDTSVDKAQIVLDKLVPRLEKFQLQNKKHITIPIEYGFVSIEDVDDYTEIYPLAREQVSEYVS